MARRIYAPWTNQQVSALNHNQTDERRHGYTCDTHSNQLLIATKDGWRCSLCSYKQNWAHADDAKITGQK